MAGISVADRSDLAPRRRRISLDSKAGSASETLGDKGSLFRGQTGLVRMVEKFDEKCINKTKLII